VLGRDGKRGPNPGTLRKVALIELLIERANRKQYIACDLVGLNPKTFRGYHNDPQYREFLDKQKEELKLEGEPKRTLGNLLKNF
jgi:hypothetical protein